MKPDYILKPGMKLLEIENLRAHQLKPVQSLMQGDDTIVIAGTASGKSAIYQLPALVHSDQLTLVIEPTLSLIYNQIQSLQECGIFADYIDHFRTKIDVDAILHKTKRGKLTFLYVTPERLQSRQFQEVMEDTHAVYRICNRYAYQHLDSVPSECISVLWRVPRRNTVRQYEAGGDQAAAEAGGLHAEPAV